MNGSTRNGAVVAMLAGLAYGIQSIMGVIKPQAEIFSGTSDYVLEAVFIVALAATIFALTGLHSFAGDRYGRTGMVGFWLTVMGTALTTISAVATLVAGQNSLGIAFLGGVLLSLIGYIVLGITTLRAKVLPTWAGLALIFGFPLSLFLSTFGGGILLGLAWLSVGYFLLRQKSYAEPKAYSEKPI